MEMGRRGWGGGSSLCARDSSRGLAPKRTLKELKLKNLFMFDFFKEVRADLGLWRMPPQQLAALSLLGWVCWGSLAPQLAQMLSWDSPCTRKQPL